MKALVSSAFTRTPDPPIPEAFRQAMRAQFVRLSNAQLLQMKEQCATLAAGADLRQIVDLSRISARTLIVNGSRDPLIDMWDTTATVDCFAHAELHVASGIGHFLHLERPSLIDVYLEFACRTSG